ncbi:MAG: chemotaxis response regulator protein-glutamate methylesterase, partial [Sphingomonas sp.]|nr:chemotaxis response regulator protein-glutamate methylesterase [Sphingomonas sp.]
RQAGARTVGQNEASCVVYGMPRVANEIGAVEDVLSIDRIAGKVLDLCSL